MPDDTEPGYLKTEPYDGHSVSFPDTTKGTDSPTQFAAHIFGVPEWGVSAANAAVNAATSLLPGFADGGHVEADPLYASVRDRTDAVLGIGLGGPRLRHEIRPGVPCPSCAAGHTIPLA